MNTDMNLPEPFGWIEPTGRSPAFHFLRRDKETGMPLYTADQMRAYGIACANAALEAAARVSEAYEPQCDVCPSGVSFAIRSIKVNHE